VHKIHNSNADIKTICSAVKERERGREREIGSERQEEE
jgi:hypothetical protein